MSDENGEKDVWDAEVRGRKRLFVLNYCTDTVCFMNGRRAYKAAYTKIKDGNPVYVPEDEVSDAGASRLLRSVKVKRAVARLLAETQPEADRENGYRLLHDLVLQATFRPGDIIDADGQLIKSLDELGDLSKCIKNIYATKYGIRVELMDRSFAQDKLLKYYNLVTEQQNVSITLPVINAGEKTGIEEWNEAVGGDSDEADVVESATEATDGAEVSG